MSPFAARVAPQGDSLLSQRFRPLIFLLIFCGLCLPVPLSAQPPDSSALPTEEVGRVSGVVIDAASDAPLPGVTVRLIRVDWTSPKAEVATDDEGRFSFDSVPEGNAHLWLGEGYVVLDEDPTNPGNSTMITVEPADERVVRLVATKGVVVQGRALDLSSGGPLPNRRLCLKSEIDGQVAYSEDVTTEEGDFLFSSLAGGRAELFVVPTRYFICVLPPNRPDVISSSLTNTIVPFARVARVEGHVSSLLPGKTDKIWVELYARTVRSTGVEKGLAVHPRCDIAKISPGEPFVLHAFGAPPDAQGTLKAYVPGRGEGQSVPIRLYAGGAVYGAAVPLKGGVSTGGVQGVVVDEDGEPVPRALVEDESHRETLADWEPSTRTDLEGRFLLLGVPPSVGKRTLFVTAAGHGEVKVPVKVKKGRITEDVRVEMKGRGLKGKWWVLHPDVGRYAPPIPEQESR